MLVRLPLKLVMWSCLFWLLSACSTTITTDSLLYQQDRPHQLDMQALSKKLSLPSDAHLQSLTLSSSQQPDLAGIVMTLPDAKANIVLYGANGMTIANHARILSRFAQLPANVIWFDYRGTGASSKPAELRVQDFKNDALRIYDFAQRKMPPHLPFVVDGIAMGTILAPLVAEQRAVDGVVLDGAIASVAMLVKRSIPWWKSPFVSVNLAPSLAAIDNEKVVPNLSQPLLFLVSEQDKEVPPEMAWKLYNNAHSLHKEWVILRDSGHAEAMNAWLSVHRYRKFLDYLNP